MADCCGSGYSSRKWVRCFWQNGHTIIFMRSVIREKTIDTSLSWGTTEIHSRRRINYSTTFEVTRINGWIKLLGDDCGKLDFTEIKLKENCQTDTAVYDVSADIKANVRSPRPVRLVSNR